MQSKPNITIKLNSENLITKALISNAAERPRNTSAKCKPNLAGKFDGHRLADKFDHHRNIGATDVYYKSKQRKINVEIKSV